MDIFWNSPIVKTKVGTVSTLFIDIQFDYSEIEVVIIFGGIILLTLIHRRRFTFTLETSSLQV